MRKKLIVALLFICTTNSFSQNKCHWINDIEDDLNNLQQFDDSYVISLDSSYSIWKKVMAHNNYNYSYVLHGLDNADNYSKDYTFIKVQDSIITERKHYSYSLFIDGYKITCSPSKDNCEYLNDISKISKSDPSRARKILKKHLEEHYSPIYKEGFYNCWEEYKEFVGAHKKFAPPPKTMDQLYKECQTYQKESKKKAEYSFEYKIDKDGILCECYLKNELLMDGQILHGINIVKRDF